MNDHDYTTAPNGDQSVGATDPSLVGRDRAKPSTESARSPDEQVSTLEDARTGLVNGGIGPDSAGWQHRGLRIQADRMEDIEDSDTPGDGPDGTDQRVDTSDHTLVLPREGRVPLHERVVTPADWPIGDLSASDEPLDVGVGLTSLGFIKTALRRRAGVWCVLALVGLLAGVGYLKVRPPAQEATTTLLLASPPTAPAGTAIQNDQTYVQSLAVAEQALQQLRLKETPATFLSHYTSTVVTNSVLQITVKASSSAEAVREANALGTALLSFQAQLLASQQKLVDVAYDQQIAQAQAHVDSITKLINDLARRPASTARTAELNGLRSQRTTASNALTTLTQTFTTDEANTRAGNATVIAESKVLNRAAPVSPSRKRALALYVGGGLIGGLALGVGIVVIGALVSDRLRRRDDIARVLGAPVRLSVGKIRVNRWQPGRRELGLGTDGNVQRIVEHLHNAVRQSSGFPASLAVVPVDDVRVPAACIVTLAVACAQVGLRVVLADLYPGTPAARLLDAATPGVRSLRLDAFDLILVVPDSDDITPVGPLLKSGINRVPKPLIAACTSADVLLTLACLDPSLGGEHLNGWATSLIAVMTAGRSSGARVYAVGEMIRQAGISSASAVLVGADKDDESLGLAAEVGSSRDVRATATRW